MESTGFLRLEYRLIDSAGGVEWLSKHISQTLDRNLVTGSVLSVQR
jgi:hypothetical protein